MYVGKENDAYVLITNFMKRHTHIYTNFLCTFLADGCSSVFMGGGSAFIGMDMMGGKMVYIETTSNGE